MRAYHHIHFQRILLNFMLKKNLRGQNAPRDIQYAPERDIAIALSEYAPGGLITIDKIQRWYLLTPSKGFMEKSGEYYFAVRLL